MRVQHLRRDGVLLLVHKVDHDLAGFALYVVDADRVGLALLLVALGLCICGETLADQHVPRVIEIRMTMSKDGTQPYFDPIGIHVQPGDTVRWVQLSNYHSVAAYHPPAHDFRNH